MEKYVPDVYQKNIFTINYQKLKQNGIKCLLFDLDNTLVPYTTRELDGRVKDLIDNLKEHGFTPILYSNSPRKRVQRYMDQLEIEGCWSARKPKIKKFLETIDKHEFTISEVAIIGDQLLTDVLGGNKAGITTVLITPIGNKDMIFTYIHRFFEKGIVRKMSKKNLFYRGKYYE